MVLVQKLKNIWRAQDLAAENAVLRAQVVELAATLQFVKAMIERSMQSSLN